MPAEAGQKGSVSEGIIAQDSEVVKRKFSERDSVDSLFEERTDVQNRLNELRQTKKELESSEEYQNKVV